MLEGSLANREMWAGLWKKLFAYTNTLYASGPAKDSHYEFRNARAIGFLSMCQRLQSDRLDSEGTTGPLDTCLIATS